MKRYRKRCNHCKRVTFLQMTEKEHSHVEEYAAGEVGSLFEFSGSKVLKEVGLKLPKVMRDMLNSLYTITGKDVKRLRKLKTLGYVHFGIQWVLDITDSSVGAKTVRCLKDTVQG